MTYDHWLSTNPADDTDPEFRFEDEEEFYVGCGAFSVPGRAHGATSEYYIARKDDGTVVERGFQHRKDKAEARCAQMNAGEDELPPDPTVEEVYIGWPVSYCHRVTFASGHVYSVVQSTSGGFIGDYEIHGPGNFYRDGYEDPEEAINWLCDPERRDW